MGVSKYAAAWEVIKMFNGRNSSLDYIRVLRDYDMMDFDPRTNDFNHYMKALESFPRFSNISTTQSVPEYRARSMRGWGAVLCSDRNVLGSTRVRDTQKRSCALIMQKKSVVVSEFSEIRKHLPDEEITIGGHLPPRKSEMTA